MLGLKFERQGDIVECLISMVILLPIVVVIRDLESGPVINNWLLDVV